VPHKTAYFPKRPVPANHNLWCTRKPETTTAIRPCRPRALTRHSGLPPRFRVFRVFRGGFPFPRLYPIQLSKSRARLR
jgi:hypothetical protein